MTEVTTTKKKPSAGPITMIKTYLAAPNVTEMFRQCLGDSAQVFMASLAELAGGDKSLQQCDPQELVHEALKAATLKLPINKNLGQAWIIARKNNREGGRMVPAMQIGYKGLKQLALRTGMYRHLNDGEVFEGEYLGTDKLTGEPNLYGKKTSDTVVGYFSHLELHNGFRKTIYMTTDEILAHAKKFAGPSLAKKDSVWNTNFPSMARKTVLTALLSKHGLISIEMAEGMSYDADSPVIPDPTTSTQEPQQPASMDVDPKEPQVQAIKIQCPDRATGDMMNLSFCLYECKKNNGCPAIDDYRDQAIEPEDTQDMEEEQPNFGE